MRPFSWVLAPTWGVDAIREAATGGGPWPEIALALGLGAVYLAIGVAVLETVLTRGAAGGHGRAVMTALRIFFVGGLISFRALFCSSARRSTSRRC